MSQFESYENFENNSAVYEYMARLFNIKNHPEKYRFLDEEEPKELEDFLKKASVEEMEKIKKMAEIQHNCIVYTDRNASPEDLKTVEEKMKTSYELRDYVEKNWAGGLTEDYVIWKMTLEDFDELKKDKARPYEERRKELEVRGIKISEGIEAGLQESAKECLERLSLNDREITNFFEFIKKYPKEIKQGLFDMYSRVESVEDSNKVKIGSSDLPKTYAEFSFLENLRKYINQEMGEKEEIRFSDLIMNDKVVWQIVDRFRKALGK